MEPTPKSMIKNSSFQAYRIRKESEQGYSKHPEPEKSAEEVLEDIITDKKLIKNEEA